jgi:hypothetical protein
LGLETEYSLPSNGEVRNVLNFTSTLLYTIMARFLGTGTYLQLFYWLHITFGIIRRIFKIRMELTIRQEVDIFISLSFFRMTLTAYDDYFYHALIVSLLVSSFLSAKL